ncbi:MAG: S24/S26 family peptidase [Pseudomonadota bacterium]
MLRVFRVRGVSMLPTIPDGSIIVAVRAPKVWLKPGRLVVVRVAGDTIVKRIEALPQSGKVKLCSDNRATVSRFCGLPLDVEQVVGIVLLSWRPGRHQRGTTTYSASR